MTQSSAKTEKLNERMNRGSKQLFIWTLAWVLSTALLSFGPKLLWDYTIAITVGAIILNLVLGLKVILVFKQHLNDMDEMQRRIHFNAMAMSLGFTMILGNLIGLLEPSGVIESSPNPSSLLVIMGLSYIVTVFINFRRYL